jgi:RNA polymerase sigma-70 factor (ECF subfamily)
MTQRFHGADDFCVLMRRAQSGDRAAYSTLLRDLLPILRHTVRCRYWTCPIHDREDVVQDILLSLHAARATYDPARPFMPWVLAIAQHRIADAQRHSLRRRTFETLVESPPDRAAEATGHPDADGDGAALHAAIAALPARQRQAMQLVKLKELSLKEAAALSGTSVGALKTSVHRAMVALRGTLQDAHG